MDAVNYSQLTWNDGKKLSFVARTKQSRPDLAASTACHLHCTGVYINKHFQTLTTYMCSTSLIKPFRK